MLWYNLSLIALLATIGLVIAFAGRPRAWVRARPLAVFGFQLTGVVMVTWLLVSAATSGTPLLPVAPPLPSVQLAKEVLIAMSHSLLLIGIAAIWGGLVGIGAAYSVTALRSEAPWLAFVATLVWVIPTFLVAVLAQELQAQLFVKTGIVISDTSLSWLQPVIAAAVLGVRPAAYAYRTTRVALALEESMEHVRVAEAKGLRWSHIAQRHVFRPAVPTLLTGWMSSLRLMVGSLPLVEFLFAYPGMGQQLILSLGLAYGDESGFIRGDVAIGMVLGMALVLLVVEAAGGMLQQRSDPRLNELLSEPA